MTNIELPEIGTKFFPKSEPMGRGQRSAVIHTELTIVFRSKLQMDSFLSHFGQTEEYPHYEVETVVGDSLTPNEFHVTIYDIPWANNLTRIASILEIYDFNEGGYD